MLNSYFCLFVGGAGVGEGGGGRSFLLFFFFSWF